MCLGMKFTSENGPYECGELGFWLKQREFDAIHTDDFLFQVGDFLVPCEIFGVRMYVVNREQRSVKNLSGCGLPQMILPDDPSLTRDFVKN